MDAVEERAEDLPALLGVEDQNASPPTRPAGKDSRDAVIQAFRTAARLTAQTLLLETEELAAHSPDHQSELEQELASAQQELSEGDASALADEDENAIQHYRQAWLHASTANLHALRTK